MAFVWPIIKSMVGGMTFFDLIVILNIIIISFVSSYFIKHIRKIVHLPPGPAGIPIMGILPFIKKEFHLLLFDFSRKYGDMCSFQMGMSTFVVLSDPKIIKKAFRSKDFTPRPKSELSSILGGYGIINSDGELWKSERRYLINQKMGMRNHSWAGNGLEEIEKRVQIEVKELIQNIAKKHDGKKLEPSLILNSSVANVICSMIMSHRFNYEDPKFQRFMFLFDEGFKLFCDTGSVTFLPFLKYMPGVKTAVSKLKANREEMVGFVDEIIAEHKKTLDPENPRDLVDSYLIKIQDMQADKSKNVEYFEGFDYEEQLRQVILDLFSAGVETVKTSLLWSMAYMLHNPEILQKVQEEIKSVVGQGNMPEIKHMSQLPYTRATMYEVMRRSSVVPMGTTHSVDRQINFNGYTIPKNAQIVPLLHACHMNPDLWEEPEQFKPERFLSENQNEVVKPDHFMPFGVGQRQCMGDQLAEKEFFLFFSSFFHCFNIEKGDEKLPDLVGISGVTVTPKKFNIVCKYRHNNSTPVSLTAPLVKSTADSISVNSLVRISTSG